MYVILKFSCKVEIIIGFSFELLKKSKLNPLPFYTYTVNLAGTASVVEMRVIARCQLMLNQYPRVASAIVSAYSTTAV